MKNILKFLSLIILMTSITACSVNFKLLDEELYEATTDSITVGDNGTEVGVKIVNKDSKTITIRKVDAILYDSTGERVGAIENIIDKKINPQKDAFIQLTTNKKILAVSEIKYKVYK